MKIGSAGKSLGLLHLSVRGRAAAEVLARTAIAAFSAAAAAAASAGDAERRASQVAARSDDTRLITTGIVLGVLAFVVCVVVAVAAVCQVCGMGNARVMPAAAPVPKAVLMEDPRSDERGYGKEVGVIGFYFPGREEAWDAICGGAFLGNFYDLGLEGLRLEAPCEPGVIKSFRNAEAAFQALKFWQWAHEFEFLSGSQAFHKKRQLSGMEDLTYAKFGSNWAGMLAVLRAKFHPDSTMASALKKTCDSFLLEHNSVMGRDAIWSDNFDGEGTNWLGLQLMLVRDELTGKQKWTQFISSLIDVDSGNALDGRAAGTWQQSVRDARNALVVVVERKRQEEQRRREEEQRKRQEKLARQQERLAKQRQKAAASGKQQLQQQQVHQAVGPQALCLAPGCGKPTWNGLPNDYCSLDCKEDCEPPRNGRQEPAEFVPC